MLSTTGSTSDTTGGTKRMFAMVIAIASDLPSAVAELDDAVLVPATK
jgi:hypothetical protein